MCYHLPQKLIPFVKENLHKINWRKMSINPHAIDILEENHDKINWY